MAYKISPGAQGQGTTGGGKTSEYTKAIEQLRAEIRFAREHAMDNTKIPVGEEELNKRDARTRFSSYSPDQKKEWIQKNGVNAALDLVRPPKSQQPEAMPGGELPLNL